MKDFITHSFWILLCIALIFFYVCIWNSMCFVVIFSQRTKLYKWSIEDTYSMVIGDYSLCFLREILHHTHYRKLLTARGSKKAMVSRSFVNKPDDIGLKTVVLPYFSYHTIKLLGAFRLEINLITKKTRKKNSCFLIPRPFYWFKYCCLLHMSYMSIFWSKIQGAPVIVYIGLDLHTTYFL